jgi:hypothetical protein
MNPLNLNFLKPSNLQTYIPKPQNLDSLKPQNPEKLKTLISYNLEIS